MQVKEQITYLSVDRLNLLKQKSSQLNDVKFKNFPIDALPVPFQDYISHCCYIKGYSTDIFGASIFAAIASAIGKTHKLYTYNGYEATANYYLIIVGSRGSNKSEPLQDAFSPLDTRQQKDYDIYRILLKNHKENPEHYPQKPFWGKYLMNDATPEAITIMLANFARGTSLKIDEIGQLLLALNKYRDGADEQFYNSAWSNQTITRDRVSGDQLMAVNPSFSMIGTIQRELLDKALAGKEYSGYSDRFLYCSPVILTVPYSTASYIDPVKKLQYSNIVNRLLKFSLDEDHPIVYLKYTDKSKLIIDAWDRRIVDILNLKTTSEVEKGIRNKLRTYIHRFALILQMSIYACSDSESDRVEISEDAATNAVKLAEYFYGQSELIRIKHKSEFLLEPWRKIYDSLPIDDATFPTGDFMDACLKNGIQERAAKLWLKNNSKADNPERLLNKVKHGIYSKA